MTALAVMVALVGAMFVAMGSATAFEYGTCLDNSSTGNSDRVNYLTVGDSCTLTHADTWTVSKDGIVELADDVSAEDGDVPGVMAKSAGTVTVTNPGTDPDTNYKFVVRAAPSIAIAFSDTDNVVASGTPVTVTVTTMGISADHAVRLTAPAPTFIDAVDKNGDGDFDTATDLNGDGDTEDTNEEAEEDEVRDSSTQFITAPEHADTDGLTTEKYTSTFRVSTAGVPAGEYTITASVPKTGNIKAAALATTKKLTVGDAGSAVATATLELGPREGQDTPKDATDDKAESGFDGASGEVNLLLTITNSLGSAANDADIQDITVIAPRGSVEFADSTKAALGELDSLENQKIPATASTNKMLLQIKSSDGQPRTIEVHVIALGRGSSATSNKVTVTFTGSLDSLSAGDASSTVLAYDVVGNKKNSSDAKDAGVDGESADDAGDADSGAAKRDQITFVVDATDSNGNTLVTPPLTVAITNPDGGVVNKGLYDVSQSGDLNNNVQIDIDTPITKALDTGDYQIKFSSGAKSSSSTFTVVKQTAADGISVEADEMAPSKQGETVTVTAMLTDENGKPVADGTAVTFTSAGRNGGNDVAVRTGRSGDVGTKAGEAKATFVIVTFGPAIITATADDKSASTVLVSTAGAVEPEAMPEEEASVSCLSELSGFATWSCGVETDASEIFDMVSGRGVTAIHLWNGSTWVRYSVVDGAMVPGSSDFMVTKSDILYISN